MGANSQEKPVSRLKDQLQILGAAEAPQPARQTPTDEVDLNELGRKLWRRKTIIVGTAVVVTLVTALVLSLLTPRYTAIALVMIDVRKQQVVDIEAVLSGPSADRSTIESEIEVIMSRDLALRVIEKLRLDREPEFNPALSGPGLFGRLWSAVTFSDPQPSADADAGTAGPSDVIARERVVDAVLGNLQVEPRGRSRVLQIAFESEHPSLAALVANTIADFYIVAQLEAKFAANQRATEWLTDRISELREVVVASEQAVEDYRFQAGLVRGTDDTLTAQEISELNTQLVIERARRSEAEARLGQVDELAGSNGDITTASEVLQSPLIQALREQEAEVARKIAELSVRFGATHPRRVAAGNEQRDLRAKIRNEINRIVQGYRNDVEVARARVNALVKALHDLKREVGQSDTAQVRLRALQREADANRSIYERYLARLKETSNQEEIQQPDATIVSQAATPERPSFPRSKLILGLSLLGSLGLGVILAFLLERLDRGLRSADQVEQLTGLPALGLVPRLPAAAGAPESYILVKPASAYAEAIRSLYTKLLLFDQSRVPKVIMVSSSMLGESKTTTVVSLAHMQAAIGKRVIIVDCDLRRPAAHRSFEVEAQPGLVDVLIGAATLDEVIQPHPKSNAWILPAGGPTLNPLEILGSDQMRDLLKSLGDDYDLVLVDSAPVAAVPDAQILGQMVDRVVFVVQWAATRQEVVMRSLRQIVDAGGDVAGILLTQVDVRQHALYGYSDSGSYYGRVNEYYTN